jgi:hypothetical protein
MAENDPKIQIMRPRQSCSVYSVANSTNSPWIAVRLDGLRIVTAIVCETEAEARSKVVELVKQMISDGRAEESERTSQKDPPE